MERAFSGRLFEIGSSSSRLTPQLPTAHPIVEEGHCDIYPGGSPPPPPLFGLPSIFPPERLFLGSPSSSFAHYFQDPNPPPLHLSPTPLHLGYSDNVKSPKCEPIEDVAAFYPNQIDRFAFSSATVGSIQKRPRTLPSPNGSCSWMAMMLNPYGGGGELEDPTSDRSDSTSGGFRPTSVGPEANRSPAPAPPVYPRCKTARRRRKRLSDRTRALERMMPWERKMDTATMLEEAHKYVRFMEAQVGALQGMPVESALVSAGLNRPVRAGREGGLGGLERLNRQQTLRVLVNSARVQERLYATGCCVFSFEQTMALKKMADEKNMMLAMFE